MNSTQFKQVVDAYADDLYRFMLKNTRSKADADDLVQITFEKLWKNRKKAKMDSVKSFLFRIAYNSMIDIHRKMRRIDFTENPPEQNQRSVSVQLETKELLDKALDRLNEDQRYVLLLRDYEGYSYAEIGEITGLSESQVKVYIFRARKKMRKIIIELDQTNILKYGG